MTENTPEPAEAPAGQNATAGSELVGVDKQGNEVVLPPTGEQGDGGLEYGDDTGNPYAGVDVSEIEAGQDGDG